MTGTTTHLDMICVCNAKGRDLALQNREKVMSITHCDELPNFDETFYLTNIISSLGHSYGFYVDHIYIDMWALVSVTGGTKEDPITVSAQCDRIEDGLATILIHISENYPELD